LGCAENGVAIVELPQQIIPTSQETEITSEPSLSRRLYGPAKPVGSGSPPISAETIYTVPADTRTTIKMLLAANTTPSSPPVPETFTLSIGPESAQTQIFSDCEVDHGTPFIVGLELTLEAGEIIQALASNVTLTINGIEVPA